MYEGSRYRCYARTYERDGDIIPEADYTEYYKEYLSNYSSSHTYRQSYQSRLENLKYRDYTSEHFYSGICDYIITNHSYGRFTIVRGKGGKDIIVNRYIREMDKRLGNQEYFSYHDVREFIDMLSSRVAGIL